MSDFWRGFWIIPGIIGVVAVLFGLCILTGCTLATNKGLDA